MKVRFISDMHFEHANVIKFDNRPFKDIDEMREQMIERWNNVVAPGDLTYVLGDMIWTVNSVENILPKLNGQIILIKGNHDNHLVKGGRFKKYFAAIKDYDDITVDMEDGKKKRVILSHYFMPFYNGHRYGAILLYGHSHVTEESDMEREIVKLIRSKGLDFDGYNVGACYPYMDYIPRTLDEIITGAKKYGY